MNLTKARGEESNLGPQTRPLQIKEILVIWLFGGVVGWTLQYLNRSISATTADANLPFEVGVGHVCTVILILWKWPAVFRLSSIRPRIIDVFAGFSFAYVVAGISVMMVGKAAIQNEWVSVNPHKVLAVVFFSVLGPIAEEIIYRGVILASLLERVSLPVGVVLTAIAATVMHDSWKVAFLGDIVLSIAYLIGRRSLVTSIIAHIFANTLILFPGLFW